jgi:microcompartment protein CcmK/EutM
VKVANVVGTVVSTISHGFYDGQRLLVCDIEGSSGYLIAVDVVDAGVGDRVLILDEGTGARQIFGVSRGPVRSVVVGIVDAVDEVDTPDEPHGPDSDS